MFEERRLNFSRHPPASHQRPRQKDFPTWICLYELEYEVWPSVAAHSGPLASTGDSEGHYGRSHLRDHGWPQILCLCCPLISLEWVAIPREHWVEQLGQGWEGAQSTSTSRVHVTHQPLLLLRWVLRVQTSASPLPFWGQPLSPVSLTSDVSPLRSNPSQQYCDFLWPEAGLRFSWSSLCTNSKLKNPKSFQNPPLLSPTV